MKFTVVTNQFNWKKVDYYRLIHITDDINYENELAKVLTYGGDQQKMNL